MSKKVRRGMHARILWPIFRAGIPEDFSNAESLTLHISRVNTALKTYVPDTHISISGNVVSFIVTAEMLKPLTSGEYRATIAYRKVSATSPTLWEPYIFDQPCFTLVDSSVDLGGATSGMEIETIELNGEIGIAKEGLPGASAYRIAVANGFDGDEVEWLLSLKRPALDAAEIATQAASSANSAAGKALDATSDLDAIKQAIADSEAIREQKEQTRQQNEVSRETTFTEKIQASEQATSAATQAANEANTAAGKAIDATSDLDDIKQALADSEAIREQKEQTRQQNELSRGTTFSQKIQASEQATSAATQAANEANTAAGKAIDATSDLDAIKQALADSEDIREQKEQTRQQNEVSRETTFTEKIQASEQATSAATQAAESANSIGLEISDNLEPALAEVLNNLHGRIVAFEQLIKAMIFRSMQIDNLDVVKNLTIHGSTNLFLTGVAAPVNLPDFAGQYYIDTANRVGYLALSESVWLKIADAVEVAANSTDMVSIKNNQEPAMAEIINHLNARILALESIIKNGLFKNTQIDTADIVKSLNLYGGTNLILIRTVAPEEVPDFIGQTYVNTAAGVAYEAVGTTSVSHWKQKTN